MFQTTNQLSSSKVWPSCAVGLTAGYLFRYHLTNLDAEIELWRVGCAKSNRHVLDTWLITLPSNLLHSGILRFDKKWKPMVPRNYLDTSFPKHQRRFKKHVDSIRNEKCFPPSQNPLRGAGIFTNIYPKNHPNVGKHTIHGEYGHETYVVYIHV